MHLVSDFDGVWTDPQPEADYIRRFMAQKLADTSGLSVDRVEENFAVIEQRFSAEPFAFGWEFGGRIAAFAGEDLYGRNHALASCIWSGIQCPDLDVLKAAISKVAGDAQKLADMCFREGRAAFRKLSSTLLVPEAAEVIDRLRSANHRLTIVSNSKVDHIVDLFEDACIDLTGVEIVGGARKFHLGECQQLPEYLNFNSARVALQRPYYFEVLKRLRPDAVIGDVFSLDLALPMYLRSIGADFAPSKIALLRRQYAPQWVLEITRQDVDVLASLAEVPGWLGSGSL
ncbi:MAG: hypothetical protein RMM17_10520 [Acidobacteriota bacterium]|nr:hypothetical protein [Blastocatellia bacterium]MDW8413104.1 hypothetical protein [Acidobacteriota bacterium]